MNCHTYLLDWGCWLAWAHGHRGAGWWQHGGEAHGRFWKMLLEEWRADRGWHRTHRQARLQRVWRLHSVVTLGPSYPCAQPPLHQEHCSEEGDSAEARCSGPRTPSTILKSHMWSQLPARGCSRTQALWSITHRVKRSPQRFLTP